jgi:NAD(P)-dependent dehydrogenase (short-subunit alcohol dehydrogenase family)
MSSGPLEGRRVLVVGASSGMGSSFARQAAAAGADVVVAARRAEALEDLVAGMGRGHAVVADICDDGQRAALVERCVEALGQVDLVLHTVGFAELGDLADADTDRWHRTLDANVVGLNQLVRGLLPHMAPGGIVAALSSEAVVHPRVGLIPYAASKAALEASLHGWRLEHPEVRFSAIVAGATYPTDFGNHFDGELLGRLFDRWAKHGVIQDRFMDRDDVGGYLVTLLGDALRFPGIGLEHVVLRSPSPVMGSVADSKGYRDAAN